MGLRRPTYSDRAEEVRPNEVHQSGFNDILGVFLGNDCAPHCDNKKLLVDAIMLAVNGIMAAAFLSTQGRKS